MPKIKAWVLIHKKSGGIVFRGGFSKDKKDIEPNKIYKKEYKAKLVEILI